MSFLSSILKSVINVSFLFICSKFTFNFIHSISHNIKTESQNTDVIDISILPDDIIQYIGDFLRPLTKKQRVMRLLTAYKCEEWKQNMIEYAKKHPYIFQFDINVFKHIELDITDYLIERRIRVCENYIRDIMNDELKKQVIQKNNLIYDIFGNPFAEKISESIWKSTNAMLFIEDGINDIYFIIIYNNNTWIKHYLQFM